MTPDPIAFVVFGDQPCPRVIRAADLSSVADYEIVRIPVAHHLFILRGGRVFVLCGDN